jgi:hypothetical protein
MRPPRTGVFGRRGVTAPDHTGFGDQFPTFFKKKLVRDFFFFERTTGTEEVKGKEPACSVGCRLKTGLIYPSLQP